MLEATDAKIRGSYVGPSLEAGLPLHTADALRAAATVHPTKQYCEQHVPLKKSTQQASDHPFVIPNSEKNKTN